MLNNYQFLIRYLKPYKYKFCIVFLGLIVTSIATLAIGYNFSQLIKIIASDTNVDNVKILNREIIQINIIILIFALGSFFRSYFIHQISVEIQNQIRMDVYQNLINKKYFEFQKMSLGNILSIITQDIKNIGDAIVNFSSFILRNVLIAFGGFILMIVTSLKLSFCILVLFCILIIFIKILSVNLKKFSSDSRNAESEIISALEENLSAMKILHIFYKQKYSVNKILANFHKFMILNSKRLKFRSLFFSFIIIFTLSSISVVIWLGNREIMFSGMDANHMISFIYYSILVAVSATSISEVLNQTNDYIASIERTKIYCCHRFTFDQETDVNKFNITQIPNNFEIEINNLNYQYNKNQNTLSDISLKIDEGEFVGIVGFSGSGKSSLINLLSRILNNYSGSISIGKINIVEIEEKIFRNIISLVSDEDALFTDTIESNILFGNKNTTYDLQEFNMILNLCGINELVQNFPLGIKTIVGQKNTEISAGQKQKILIARAMIAKPKILLIDEATNSIDTNWENKILKSIKTFLPQTTIVYITHRTSNLYLTDSIVILHNGLIVERGIYNNLLQKSNIFKKLVNQENSD